MNLGEAQKMMAPYTEHPNFAKLNDENEELQEVVGKIREKMKTIQFHFMGEALTEMDDETEALFKREANICRENLKH